MGAVRFSVLVSLLAVAWSGQEPSAELEPGYWPGFTGRDGTFPVCYVVRREAAGLVVDMTRGNPRPMVSFTDVRIDGDALRFAAGGATCTLRREADGAFRGICALPNGNEEPIAVGPRVEDPEDLPEICVAFDPAVEQPAYSSDGPRLMVDAGHHNRRSSERGYVELAAMWGNDGYDVVANHERFTAEVLEDHEVLVVANALPNADAASELEAASAFNSSEIEAIAAWVMDGGGLLLIADHLPLPSAAMELASAFGVEMMNSYTADPDNAHRPQATQPAGMWLVFSRANGLLLDHPITNGRGPSEHVQTVITGGGQSLTGPPGSSTVMALSDTAADWLVGPAGAAPMNELAPRSAAGRAQGVAFEFGDGRVVVLGEAGMLSAGYLKSQDRDHRQFALNIVHWLSGLLD